MKINGGSAVMIGGGGVANVILLYGRCVQKSAKNKITWTK